MAALFPRWANPVLALCLGAGLLATCGGLTGLMIYVYTPYVTGQDRSIEQPVKFDHRHHVVDDNIDCLYCHSGAERTARAGVPPTEVCMGCHGQIYRHSPLLAPVRASYFSNRPLRWKRVHDLADFVYFHHGIHVQAGVACVTCHGRVDTMARIYQVAPLTMSWCLDCHRHPRERLARQPRAPGLRSTLWGWPHRGKQLGQLAASHPAGAEQQRITRLTTCTACHR